MTARAPDSQVHRLHVPSVRGLQPKHNIEAELDMLAACLWKPETFDVVRDMLKAEHFFASEHQALWEACCAVSEDGCDVSTVTVRNWLADRQQLEAAGGVAFINGLAMGRPAVGQPERLAATIRNAWRQRELASRCQAIAAQCYADVGDLQEFIERAETQVGELAHGERVETSASLRVCIEESMSSIATEGATWGVRTGMASVDEMTLGLHDGDLTIVGARPGMGKTAMVMQWAVNAAGGVSTRDDKTMRNGVMVFSLEMPKRQLGMRAVCSAARVNMTSVRAGTASATDWRNLADVATWMGNADLVIDDQPAITPAQLRSRCRRQRAEWRKRGVDLRLVVVDYLQLMDGRFGVSARASREEQVSFCARSLKAIAKELGVPVVACAQLNRGVAKGGDRRPQLHDLRESGSIEQDADNVVFIHREEYYLGEKTPVDERGMAEVIVAKQRNGATGTRRCRFFGAYTAFADL